jgi:hypothetical protein
MIALPEGNLVVHVHSGDQAIPDAVVTTTLRRDAADGMESLDSGNRTDSAGDARFESLPFGTWIVTAQSEHPSRMAERPIVINGREATKLDLEIGELAGFNGVVQRASGTVVPNAAIRCIVARAGQLPEIADAQSDGDGRFSIDLAPPLPPVARCGVAIADGSVQGFKMAPDSKAEVVTLNDATAALHITGSAKDRSALWLVDSEGDAVDLSRWMTRSESFLLPALAAGAWKIVRVGTLADWIALGQGGSLAPVAEISLGAGERKSIDVSQNSLR